MESEPVDVLVNARPGDALTDRWVMRLRTLGVTAAAGGELRQCRSLVLCLTHDDENTRARQAEVLRAALDMHVPTVLVMQTPLGSEADARLLGTSAIVTQGLGPVEVWHQVLRALHAREAIQFDPDAKPSPVPVTNEFRRETQSHGEWRMAALATLVVAVACLCWWVFLKHDQQERLRDQMGQPLLPVQPDPTPKAVPITTTPAAELPTPVPQTNATGPSTAGGDQASRAERAIALVQECISAGTREDGFSTEQINALTRRFTNPVFVAGKGEQTTAALEASLTVRSQEWPKWQENIAFIKVDDATPDAASVVVVVRSSFFASNRDRGTSTHGALVTRYTVIFDAGGQPVISRIEASALP